jgi:hypothetical protein
MTTARKQKHRRRGRDGRNLLIDLSGQQFGRWRVLALHPKRMRYGKANHAVAALWMCRCSCGTERLVLGTNLRTGMSQSCGCLSRETTRKRSTKHGHARHGKVTRAYACWSRIKQRCYNPNHKDYPDYGGRGIGFAEHWRHSFTTWYADTGDPPPGCSIDRIDVNGNYEPGNVRWATPSVQAANRRPRKRKGRRANVAQILAFAASLARAASASGGVRRAS